MQTPTAEQVRTLAPDASAARAGEELGNPRRWTALGRSEVAAWGLCQGSGSAPYQAAVDLSGPAYRCSCPSRKIPCKHALGLLFLLADDKVALAPPPDWTASWLEGRAARAAAADAPGPAKGETDPAARAKRVESRERKVALGLEELDRWLGDLVRRGLDAAHAEGYRFWDAMGARLVDAQAPGLGRSVRALGSAAAAGDAWPQLLLDGAARLHLACTAYARADALPPGLVADVRSLVGWTIREEDLAEEHTVEDRWLAIGRRVDDGGQVVTARTYLVGEATGRPALHLAFGVPTAPPTAIAAAGQAFRGRLAFYPSATPLRAAVRPVLAPDGDVRAIPGAVAVTALLDAHARRLADNPFAERWPVVLGPVVPVLAGERLLARDEAGLAVPVVPVGVAPILLAVSGGHPVTVCGEWDGAALRPLSVLADGRLVPIELGDEEVGSRLAGDAVWDGLVSAALLGTERLGGRAPIPDELGAVVMAGTDAERSLLGAAAATSLRLRAGRLPVEDPGAWPPPAATDPRRPVEGAAARLLAIVARERRDLVAETLALVRRSGRRLPDETLPALLRLGADDDVVRGVVDDLGGPRAAWLVARIPSLGGSSAPAAATDPAEAWAAAATGRAKAALVRSWRRADPAAARELLAGRLAEVAGDERADLVAALGVGLAAADEPLLAAALGERRQDVRRAAADLLARLEGSAFVAGVEAAARPLIASTGVLRAGVSVALPADGADGGVAGLAGKAPQGYGERAWLLRHLVAHVRPARWSEWLRAEPRELVERVLRTDEARPVLDGWVAAAERFADEAWVAALLAEPRVAATVELRPERLVLALPAAGRARVVPLASHEPSVLAATAGTLDAPWERPVADAVLGALRRLGGPEWPDPAYYALARAAASRVPTAEGDELVSLCGHAGRVRPSLEEAVDTIRLRARIHQAFADLPPTAPEEPR